MARRPRVVLPVQPIYVVHRGNVRQAVFYTSGDRVRYLAGLADAARLNYSDPCLNVDDPPYASGCRTGHPQWSWQDYAVPRPPVFRPIKSEYGRTYAD